MVLRLNILQVFLTGKLKADWLRGLHREDPLSQSESGDTVTSRTRAICYSQVYGEIGTCDMQAGDIVGQRRTTIKLTPKAIKFQKMKIP